MTPFVEKTYEEKVAARQAMTDAVLIGSWHLEDLDSLASPERDRLVHYRLNTLGFYDHCDADVASGPGWSAACVADLHALLDRWNEAYLGLRRWQDIDNAARADSDRNPVGKVLKSESSFIGTFRCQLPPGGTDD